MPERSISSALNRATPFSALDWISSQIIDHKLVI
jgi:hypothetical protein